MNGRNRTANNHTYIASLGVTYKAITTLTTLTAIIAIIIGLLIIAMPVADWSAPRL